MRKTLTSSQQPSGETRWQPTPYDLVKRRLLDLLHQRCAVTFHTHGTSAFGMAVTSDIDVDGRPMVITLSWLGDELCGRSVLNELLYNVYVAAPRNAPQLETLIPGTPVTTVAVGAVMVERFSSDVRSVMAGDAPYLLSRNYPHWLVASVDGELIGALDSYGLLRATPFSVKGDSRRFQ